MKERAAAAEKRQKTLEAAKEGEQTQKSKQKKPQPISGIDFEDERMDMPSFDFAQFRSLLRHEDSANFFTVPFIVRGAPGFQQLGTDSAGIGYKGEIDNFRS